MKRILVLAAGLSAFLLLNSCQHESPADQGRTPDASPEVWRSDAYTLYRDSLVQGPYVARAVSRQEITSNYRSPANKFQSPEVLFKFSLNGADNELPPGQDHRLLALGRKGAALRPPVITFGQRYVDARPVPADKYLAPNTPLTLRVDLRPVLAAFKKQGYYETWDHQKFYKADFKGVFVAGNTAPLTWDFANLGSREQLQMQDANGDGIYEITITLNAPEAARTTAPRWRQTLDVSDLPQYTSDYPLADALYNMALEEARRAVEPDSTFRTGESWAGVWTRDISYSIILAQASLQPQVAMNSLLRKVTPDGRIVQDTGTGGAYPCSTDRVVWAVAAWEVYKATGDEAWLRRVYPIIEKSLTDDRQNAYNPATGLMRGESSFLDWREQTYPAWMQPADIYESETLGTNAVHYQANQAAAQMARHLGNLDAAARHEKWADGIRQAINQHLWQADKGYYGQYRYGRLYPVLSPRAEALGEALAVLFGVADASRARRVVRNVPTVPFGVPCIYPQIPGIAPYHNNGVWPFVQSYWALAAARAGNEASLTESMAAIYRPAALFLTNKENFVAESGDFAGTQINSSNMLWSLSGNLGLVYHVLFGMQLEADRLVFRPFVPEAFAGKRQLTGFRYRQAILDIEMTGFGNEIEHITLDGQALPNAAVPAPLIGRHKVHIKLKSKTPPPAEVTRVANAFTPATPQVTYAKGRLTWPAVPGATAYQVLRNGQPAQQLIKRVLPVPATEAAEYQVQAVGDKGRVSFASEPLLVGEEAATQLVQLETVAPRALLPYQGFTSQGFVEISARQNQALRIPLTVPAAGRYAVDFRYANGNGPVNTASNCALRTLRRAGQAVGTVVLPQRGADEWSNWGFTNAVLLDLPAGPTELTLRLEPANANMGEHNQAMLDYLRLRRLPASSSPAQ